jgi:hypothetical protein
MTSDTPCQKTLMKDLPLLLKPPCYMTGESLALVLGSLFFCGYVHAVYDFLSCPRKRVSSRVKRLDSRLRGNDN